MKIWPILPLIVSFNALSAPLSIDTFLQSFLGKSQQVQMATLERDQSINRFKSIEFRYQLESNLSLYRQESNYDFPGGLDYQLDSNILQASLAQTIGIGTKVTADGQFDYSAHSEYDKNQRNYSYSLMLSQPLYRNSFGSLFSKEKFSRQAMMHAKEFGQKEALLNSCVQGIEDYLTAYILQQKLALLERTEKNSKEIWSFVQASYANKLINELGYLTAKAERSDNVISIEQTRLELENAKGVLARFTPIDRSSSLASPFSRLQQIELIMQDEENNLQLKKLKEEVRAMSFQYEMTKDANRSDISLVLKAGRSVTQNDYSFSVAGDNKNDYVMMGVSASLPLFDPIKSSEIRNSFIDKQMAEIKYQETAQDIVRDHAMLFQRYHFFQKQVRMLEEKLVVLEKRSGVALNGLKRGKLELIDYYSYRDSASQGAVALLMAQDNLFRAKTGLIAISGVLPTLCGGLQ